MIVHFICLTEPPVQGGRGATGRRARWARSGTLIDEGQCLGRSSRADASRALTRCVTQFFYRLRNDTTHVHSSLVCERKICTLCANVYGNLLVMNDCFYTKSNTRFNKPGHACLMWKLWRFIFHLETWQATCRSKKFRCFNLEAFTIFLIYLFMENHGGLFSHYRLRKVEALFGEL